MGKVACVRVGATQRDFEFISLDSVSVKAQPGNDEGTDAKRSGLQSGGSPCRRLKKAIRKARNRRRTQTSPRPICRPTRRRKARASPPAARSRKRPDVGARAQDHLTHEPTKHFLLTFRSRSRIHRDVWALRSTADRHISLYCPGLFDTLLFRANAPPFDCVFGGRLPR